jgi:hypothetical protein
MAISKWCCTCRQFSSHLQRRRGSELENLLWIFFITEGASYFSVCLTGKFREKNPRMEIPENRTFFE